VENKKFFLLQITIVQIFIGFNKMLYKKSNTGKIRCNYRRDCYNKTDAGTALSARGGVRYVKRQNSSSGSDRKYCGI